MKMKRRTRRGERKQWQQHQDGSVLWQCSSWLSASAACWFTEREAEGAETSAEDDDDDAGEAGVEEGRAA